MKTYQATYIPNKTDGVFGISLVENPAMEGNFIALSKHAEVKLAEVDKEQRILMGLVLEPNKKIYRNQGGEEFNIVFNEETIKDLSYNFFKAGYQTNSTIEHDANQRIEGVTFVESWIVEDPKNDKSNAFGFSYPKGSWVATMKVDSDEIWNGFVKTGKVKGFSVDAMINLEEVNLKSNITMAEEKSLIDTIRELPQKIAMALSPKEDAKAVEEVKLGMVKTEDGVEIHYQGETLEVGVEAYALTEDGEKIPLPEGEHKTEEGVIVVDANGTITEVKGNEVVEEAPADVPLNDEAPVTPALPQGDLGDELEKAIKSIMIKYSTDLDAKFETFKSEFTKQNDTLKAEVLELSKQPATKAIKTASQKQTQTGVKLSLTERLNAKL